MKIAVVLVTYNRLNMLKKALELYKNQSRKPDLMVIVNNNSTDGTKDYITEWINKNSDINVIIKDLPSNIGGSGGYYEGLQETLKHEFDWVWISDDDAFPEETAFAEFFDFINRMPSTDLSQIAAISGMVINNGEIDLTHRRRVTHKLMRFKDIDIRQEEYQKEFFELDIFSYVGTLINCKKLQKAGLPERDYFILFDDTEHSLRLRKHGKIYCVPAIKIEHNRSDTSRVITWKRYYGLRNKLLMVKKHFNFFVYLRMCYRYFKKSFAKPQEVERSIYHAALCDGINNRQGLHEVYKPGWKN
jgi:GT2 family glycosyltransferase